VPVFGPFYDNATFHSLVGTWSASGKRTRMVNVFSSWSVVPIAVFCWVLESSSLAQRNDTAFQFENYRSDEVFQSGSVAPKITDPVHRKYRTRIRDGVEKGWGAFREGVETIGPNFAGHMIAVRWGCGTGCAAMVFVDARTGKIFNPPLPIGRIGDQQIGLPMFHGGIAEVEYRLASRLFRMNASPTNRADSRSMTPAIPTISGGMTAIGPYSGVNAFQPRSSRSPGGRRFFWMG
jgi:hypothetical protein